MPDAPKKTLYHSELVKRGPVQVTVKSEPTESQKKRGSFYVSLVMDGFDRYYNIDSEACGKFFEGRIGQTISIMATGGKGDEGISLVGPASNSAAPPPAPARQCAPQQTTAHNPAPPSGNADKDFARKAGRVAFALRICAKYCNAIAKECGWKPEDARAMANTMFIEIKGTTDFNALPVFDPRQSQPAQPPAPPEPGPFPSEGEFPGGDDDSVPF